MYDIQFIIPVSTKNKYARRLDDFINCYGIYNVKNRKIKIYFLIGTDEIKMEINKNPNVDIEFVKSTNDNMVVKIYDFFSNMTKEQASQANWTAKIDDDSYNDIDETMNVLNDYDFNEKHYLVPQPIIREDLHSIEILCLKNTNLDKKVGPNIGHELEACWVSKKTMTDIVENKDCKTLFKERIKYSEGHTDQCLALAAKLNKTPIQKEVRFYADLSANKKIIDCTLFGGTICHYHPLSHDKNPIQYDLVANKILKIKNKDFEDKSYIIRYQNESSYYLIEIKLKEYGTIEIRNNWIDNWIVINDELVLLNNGKIVTKLKTNDLIDNKKIKNEFFTIFEVV